MILLTTNQPYSFKVWKGGIYMKKANPKELRQIFNKVCSLQWDLGKDESVQGRGLKVIEYFKEDIYIVHCTGTSIKFNAKEQICPVIV